MQLRLSTEGRNWSAIAAGAAVALVCIGGLWFGACSNSVEEPAPGDGRQEPGSRRTPQTSLDALRATGYGGWDPLDEDSPPGAAQGVVSVTAVASPAPFDRIWADDRHTIRIIDPGGRVTRAIHVPERTQVEFARPLPGGRILALSVDEGLTLLEPDGSVAWTLDLKAHHEALVVPRPGDLPGARLFAVATHTARPFHGRTVRFDEVRFVEEATGLGADPVKWPTWDTWKHRGQLELAASQTPHPLSSPAALGPGAGSTYDYFHLNGLAFDGDGEMVVCLRNVSMIAGIELGTGALRWSIGEDTLDWPHAPSIVTGPMGERRILAFDNGTHRGWSRVVELVPETGEVAWAYAGTQSRPLWSRVRGFAERLPGGHTLITESERGRVIEIDRDGTVIWEFVNPEIQASDSGKKRRRIYRMGAVR